MDDRARVEEINQTLAAFRARVRELRAAHQKAIRAILERIRARKLSDIRKGLAQKKP